MQENEDICKVNLCYLLQIQRHLLYCHVIVNFSTKLFAYALNETEHRANKQLKKLKV